MILKFSSYHEDTNQVFVRPFVGVESSRALSIEDAVRANPGADIDASSLVNRIDAIQQQIRSFFGKPGQRKQAIPFIYIREQKALVDALVNYCGLSAVEAAALLKGYTNE